MKKLDILAAPVLTTGVSAYGVAHAATVQSYEQPAFEAEQKSGDPILIFVGGVLVPDLHERAADSPAALRHAGVCASSGL